MNPLMKTPKIRFVIFGQGRSGSTLLVKMLNAHPDITCDLEVMNARLWGRISRRLLLPLWRYYPIPLFSYKAARRQRRAYGFKLFFDHCKRTDIVLAQMYRQGWRIIYNQRRDVLTQAISLGVAQTTHRWHRRNGKPVESTTIFIQPALVLTRLATYLADKKRITGLLAKLPHLDICYEDDLEDTSVWERTSSRLLEYLGLPVMPLTASQVKTWDRPYSELIDNYAEIIAAVRNSEYAYLLDS
jgi:hypothetical protein